MSITHETKEKSYCGRQTGIATCAAAVTKNAANDMGTLTSTSAG
jgi:hypothetical protein